MFLSRRPFCNICLPLMNDFRSSTPWFEGIFLYQVHVVWPYGPYVFRVQKNKKWYEFILSRRSSWFTSPVKYIARVGVFLLTKYLLIITAHLFLFSIWIFWPRTNKAYCFIIGPAHRSLWLRIQMSFAIEMWIFRCIPKSLKLCDSYGWIPFMDATNYILITSWSVGIVCII